MRPPTVMFVTPCYHPNVHESRGDICLDILQVRTLSPLTKQIWPLCGFFFCRTSGRVYTMFVLFCCPFSPCWETPTRHLLWILRLLGCGILISRNSKCRWTIRTTSERSDEHGIKKKTKTKSKKKQKRQNWKSFHNRISFSSLYSWSSTTLGTSPLNESTSTFWTRV